MEKKKKQRKKEVEEATFAVRYKTMEIGQFLLIYDLKIEETVKDKEGLELPSKEEMFARLATDFADENEKTILSFKIFDDSALFLLY